VGTVLVCWRGQDVSFYTTAVTVSITNFSSEMQEKTIYWFPAKTYGWGWGIPKTWQGWLVLAVYSAGLLVSSLLLDPQIYPKSFSFVVVLLSGLLLIICWKKGEPTRWRWGKE
jgi:hypothetical protein